MMGEFNIRSASVRFWIKVKPRGRREKLERKASGEICFETTVPPVDGKANAAIVDFLASTLRVPRNAIAIKMGTKSKRKLIEISGVAGAEIYERVNAFLSRAE